MSTWYVERRMAKNPSNRKALTSSTRRGARYTSKSKAFPWTAVLLTALAALGVGWAGWSWWQGRQVGGDFARLAEQGKPQLGRVIERLDAGRLHAALGQPLGFRDDPPTSGTHWPSWTSAGFYTAAEPKEKLVHSMEHGNVVIYYDQPGDEALRTLRAWAGRFRGQWDGLVVVRKAGIGRGIELTAWNRLLRLEGWDAAAAAAFVDAYRGRGPENPVR